MPHFHPEDINVTAYHRILRNWAMQSLAKYQSYHLTQISKEHTDTHMNRTEILLYPWGGGGMGCGASADLWVNRYNN